MDPTPCIDEFRAEVRAYIRTHLPVELRKLVEAERMDIPKDLQRYWHRRLQVKNWGCPGWPGGYGGPGGAGREEDGKFFPESGMRMISGARAILNPVPGLTWPHCSAGPSAMAGIT